MHQISHHPFSATSAFTWRRDGQAVAYVADGSVIELSITDGDFIRLTPQAAADTAPTHHACVYSPDGTKIAFMSTVHATHKAFTQLFVVDSAGR
jgi:Tol biopolymer transport system component